ncbi:MAG: hypothetical protein PVH89_13150, partial [Gammaproteobacteria bacterium]
MDSVGGDEELPLELPAIAVAVAATLPATDATATHARPLAGAGSLPQAADPLAVSAFAGPPKPGVWSAAAVAAAAPPGARPEAAPQLPAGELLPLRGNALPPAPAGGELSTASMSGIGQPGVDDSRPLPGAPGAGIATPRPDPGPGAMRTELAAPPTAS